MTRAEVSGYYNNVIKVALTPYQRGISQFIVRQIIRVYGDDEQRIADAIRSLLDDEKHGRYFSRNLSEGKPIEKCFGPGAFPQIVNRGFGKVFSGFLRGDKDRRFRGVLYDLRDDRNDATYDSAGMTKEECQRVLGDMVWALQTAGQHSEQDEIQEIKEQMENGAVILTDPGEDYISDDLLGEPSTDGNGEEVSEESEEIASAKNTLGTAVEPPDSEETATSQEGGDSDLDSDGFLVSGTYAFIVTLIQRNTSSNGNSQFVIDFAHKGTGLIVQDWYPIGFSTALSKLAQLMTEFGIDKAGLTEAAGNERAMDEILDRLNSRLDSKDVFCDVIRGTWPDGRPRNTIERIINPDPSPPGTPAIAEVAPRNYKPIADEDDLPF